jgi:hypothetical protein
MITWEKLRIYEKFGGDADDFARRSKQSERLSITDEDWRVIEELRQSLSIVQSGLASADFEARVRAQTFDVAQDEHVRERLFQLSRPKT